MLKPITSKERAAIHKSVADARQRLQELYQGFYFVGQPGEVRIINRTFILKAYRHDLGRLALPLNSPQVKSLLLEAAEANDRNFFVNFGKALTSKPIPFTRNKKISNLQWFPLQHWAEKVDDLPELFYLTPTALTLVCRAKLKLNGLAQDTVVKTRQRLGLKCFKRLKLYAVR